MTDLFAITVAFLNSPGGVLLMILGFIVLLRRK